mgnify:CR=1 FL=1
MEDFEYVLFANTNDEFRMLKNTISAHQRASSSDGYHLKHLRDFKLQLLKHQRRNTHRPAIGSTPIGDEQNEEKDK